MNSSVFRISLDMYEINTQLVLHVKKGDTARRILITLTENGKPYYITSDCTAVFTAQKPDGKLIYNACTIQGNVVEYAMTAQTTAAAGEMLCEIRLYGADFALITSPRFIVIVDDTVYSGGEIIVESSDEFSALTRLVEEAKAVKREIEEALANGELKGDTGETSLPIARGTSADGIAYTATDDASGTVLPTVSVADNANQIAAVGKGLQIVFVPMLTNNAVAPTLQLNGGEIIPIRLRAPKNQGGNDQSPDATLPVPAGALMRGVPYTLTFCGKYWLVDSQITQFDQYNAAMIDAYASALIRLSDGDTIAVPIINSMDGVSGDMATMFVTRSAAENANPNENGDVTVPTVEKVSELIATAIGDTASAFADMDSVIGGDNA